MDINTLHELLRTYKEDLLNVGATIPHETEYQRMLGVAPLTPAEAKDLGLGMIENLISMEYDDEGKVCRWLGFLQGLLVMAGVRTINEMREENRRIFRP